MSDLMRLIPFENMLDWIFDELKQKNSIFGVKKDKFYQNKKGTYIELFGEKLSTPLGPAAGPNSQLAQNIAASYLTGSRFIELKTVQKMDGEELRKCVAKPCINAEDECYNVEWSTELTVEEAFKEYVKAWFLLHVLGKELGLASQRDFAFNMSVGYDLEGIKSEKIDRFIEGMKDASGTAIWKECIKTLQEKLSAFKHFTQADLEAVSTAVCPSITLSTLHGCPPDEIERIANYLLKEKKLHTYIKCNPTLLGYPFARTILDEMGYTYISFDDHHFTHDLQYGDGVAMLKRLMAVAESQGLAFGVKLTNTFPVKIKRNELPGEEMYMSGRSLFPLTISLAKKLTNEFDGKLPISYSGGADFFNIREIAATGIAPITMATTLLKPGGYERITQLAEHIEEILPGPWKGVDRHKLNQLADTVIHRREHQKEFRTVGNRKTTSPLGLFDCFKAPCKDGGCPIEQQIPEYLRQTAQGNFKEAFDIIAIDNALPAVTGAICNHACQEKCTRLDYDSPLAIRQAKKIASDNAQQQYIDNLQIKPVQTDKKAVVIGAGPAGIACALYLRRNGVAVDVLEKRNEPYGIVKYVIPAFRISYEAMQLDFEMAKKAGVQFTFGVDENYDIVSLKEKYDYVILATGAWKEGAPIVDEGQDKILDALQFLQESKEKELQVSLGKRVAIIGGGDVAMDCARAAKKAPGVEEAIVVYRRTREFMPAEKEEIALALKDGVTIMELLSPKSFDGKVLVCEEMTLSDMDASGRRSVKGTGKTKTLAFDTVIGAVGARIDTTLFEQNGLALEKGKVAVNEHNESSLENVYIAGDCKQGPATIVKAMADGKKIAKDILSKLALGHDFIRMEDPQNLSALYAKKGVLMEENTGKEDGYRCLSCDQICELCCDVCPNRANIYIMVEGFNQPHQIIHLDGMCNECGNCGVFCPHSGNPYKDKLTLFWTKEDFYDSTNKGFLPTGKDAYQVRTESGAIVAYKKGEDTISPEIKKCIEAIENNYPFYLINL